MQWCVSDDTAGFRLEPAEETLYSTWKTKTKALRNCTAGPSPLGNTSAEHNWRAQHKQLSVGVSCCCYGRWVGCAADTAAGLALGSPAVMVAGLVWLLGKLLGWGRCTNSWPGLWHVGRVGGRRVSDDGISKGY